MLVKKVPFRDVQGLDADSDYVIVDHDQVTQFDDKHALVDYLHTQVVKTLALAMTHWGDDEALRAALLDNMLAVLSGNA